MAPSSRESESSTTCASSNLLARPVPAHVGHIPPVREKSFTTFFLPVASLIAPPPDTLGTLKEYAPGPPALGSAMREYSTRSIGVASVAVPTVERTFAPSADWSTTMAAVTPSKPTTSGRAIEGTKPCTKEEYVSLISRCDSAAMVSNTSEDFPDPETPATAVKRRFGMLTETLRRLFSFAPVTTMASWASGKGVFTRGKRSAVAKQKARGEPRAKSDPDGT